MKVVAIDIGASSGRLFVVSYENGFFKEDETYRFYNGAEEKNGHLIWDFDRLMNDVLQGLSVTFTKYKDIKSISVDTWGCDYGLLNTKGELIRDPYAYRDSRNIISAAAILKKVDYKKIYNHCGIQNLPFNTLFQLASDVKSGVQFDKFLMIPDLIVYFLTGKQNIELTNISTTALYNSKKREISKYNTDLIKLDRSKIPGLIEPCKLIGSLKPELIKKYKLYDVDVVSCGSHDTASAVASIKLEENSAYLSSGTWSLLGVELKEPVITEDSCKFNFTNEIGLNHSIRFLKNIMGLFIIQELRKDFLKTDPQLSFQQMQDMASKVTSNNVYVDIDDELFQQPNNMLEKFYKYLEKTNQFKKMSIGEICRCIYESLAFKYLLEIKKLEKLIGKDIKKLIIIGGGGNAKVLDQIIADTLNVKVELGEKEATVYGNALAQFIYHKVFMNLADARYVLSLKTKKEQFQPMNSKVYAEKFEKYKEICIK